jgi:LAGLIDADG endonuclease
MENLINYLDCGLVFNQTETAVVFKVRKFSDLIEKIIPFFVKYPIHGVKAKDFLDFCRVVELMKNKEHLTTEGLEEIRKIKAGMNKGRQ